ncbi:ABC transporter permease [Halodurantibacterium flavum]|uniref:ABC transporter permease n=1 Tax=Halodurantibacterium flavum TaxID=1382802 RepID=A0ABW4S0G1_9RHOB
MALLAYLLKRLLYTLPLLLAVIVVIFLLINAAPGDPVDFMIGEAGADQAVIDRLRAQLGLDQPLPVRMWAYIQQVLSGNLGYSFSSGAPVLTLILDRFPATLLLMGTQYTLAAIVGITLGVLAARKPRSRTDTVITFISLASFAIPVFWLGQMMILVLAYQFNWFPIQGMANLRRGYTGMDYALDVAYHMVLPAATLALSNIGLITRLTRSSMIGVLGQDYVKVARAKGLGERAVLVRHALRNSLLPVITVIGDTLPGLIAGAVIVETVFGWPGLGRLTLDAINARDYPLLMGMFLAISVFVIVINLIVDLLYAVLDPRIRYQ